MVDFSKAVAAAAAVTNMNEASAGGDFTPLAEGACRLRFVGYIELGKQPKEYKGVKKLVDRVKLFFEVSGPRHPLREDGSPNVVEVLLTKSNSEKAKFYKLYKRMAEGYNVTHIAELLGNAYRAEIRNHKVGEGDNARVYSNLDTSDGAWTIKGTTYTDEETGEERSVKVDEAKSAIRCFLWDFADMDQWNSIYIDGEYEATEAKDGQPARPAKSKNRFQNTIMSADNWAGSVMANLLEANGIEFEPGQQIEQEDEQDNEDNSGAAGDPLETAG